jgi:hypothetical protein
MTRSTASLAVLVLGASLAMLGGCRTTVVQPAQPQPVQKEVIVKDVPEHHDDHRQPPPPPPPDRHDDHH